MDKEVEIKKGRVVVKARATDLAVFPQQKQDDGTWEGLGSAVIVRPRDGRKSFNISDTDAVFIRKYYSREDG